MNLQSLIVVILRLMALNFFLQVAVRLSPRLPGLLRFPGRVGSQTWGHIWLSRSSWLSA